MTHIPPARRGYAWILSSLNEAAMQAAVQAWIAWATLSVLTWILHLEIPVLAWAIGYGLTTTLLVAAHELGHVVAALAQRVEVRCVRFEPWGPAPAGTRTYGSMTRSGRAWLALAGPIAGTGAALAVLALHVASGHPFLLMACIRHLRIEANYLEPAQRPFVTPTTGHDGLAVLHALGPHGRLDARSRRRLKIGRTLTLCLAASGLVCALLMSFPLAMTVADHLDAVVRMWRHGS